MKRIVIKNLQEPDDGPKVKVLGNLSPAEAERLLKRFTKLEWDLRRPGVYTIDHIALCIEADDQSAAAPGGVHEAIHQEISMSDTVGFIELDSETFIRIDNQREYNTYVYVRVFKGEQVWEGALIPPKDLCIGLNNAKREELIRALGGTPNGPAQGCVSK